MKKFKVLVKPVVRYVVINGEMIFTNREMELTEAEIQSARQQNAIVVELEGSKEDQRKAEEEAELARLEAEEKAEAERKAAEAVELARLEAERKAAEEAEEKAEAERKAADAAELARLEAERKAAEERKNSKK